MKDFQEIGTKELQGKLEALNYWSRIHTGKLRHKLQDESPSKIIDHGVSRMITYYNEEGKYLCTIHRVLTKDGNTIHEDVKDAFLEGIWFRSVKYS
jgi:hypothetical protein